MNSLPTEDKPLSKQRRWQLARFKDGKCEACGASREEERLHLCYACLARRRELRQERIGDSPWKKGRRGRPPAEAKARAEREG